MAQESFFRGAITFLGDLGVYNVLLPFILVFTIVFAILEKTKIFGVEKVGGEELSKKNINSITAFVVAFLVVASTNLVAVINEVMANVVLLLLLAICFLLLVGVFYEDKQFSLEKSPGWVTFFMFLMFFGISIIFLNSLGWLQAIIDFIFEAPLIISPEAIASIVLLVIVIIFIFLIVRDPRKKKEESKKE